MFLFALQKTIFFFWAVSVKLPRHLFLFFLHSTLTEMHWLLKLCLHIFSDLPLEICVSWYQLGLALLEVHIATFTLSNTWQQQQTTTVSPLPLPSHSFSFICAEQPLGRKELIKLPSIFKKRSVCVFCQMMRGMSEPVALSVCLPGAPACHTHSGVFPEMHLSHALLTATSTLSQQDARLMSTARASREFRRSKNVW